jgi:Zn-finger nucleic acid-binding protein
MQCPKCQSVMESVQGAYGKPVDRCTQCQGLFISMEAMESICREWFMWPSARSEHRIDVGNRKSGREYDAVDDIDCPVCLKQMAKVNVEGQSHISLEQCTDCEGIFFDAGELTDTRYKTLVDWVRKRLKPPRPGDRPASIPR